MRQILTEIDAKVSISVTAQVLKISASEIHKIIMKMQKYKIKEDTWIWRISIGAISAIDF